MEWQPIETAPKDGTIIWLWGTCESSPQARPHVGCEDMETGFWVPHGWYSNNGNYWIVEPTYWQPLPEPPKEKTNAD
jgi:hypothetical protein